MPIYNGSNSCPANTKQKLIATYNVKSNDPDGETISLNSGNSYLFKASQTFIPTSAKGYLSDAGYTLRNRSPLSQYGIKGTGVDYGAHALLGDLGDGVGIINCGDYTEPTNTLYIKKLQLTTLSF